MTTRTPWRLAGVLAGLAGLATSYATAMVFTIREAPVVAVAELVIRLTPGAVAERAIQVLGHLDKPVLVGGVVVLVLACFAWAGSLARRSWWSPLPVWVALAAVGLVAVLSQRGAGVVDVLPVGVGLVTWIAVHAALVDALRRGARRPDLESRERRVFVMVAGVIAVASLGIAVAGRVVGAGRRQVEASRQLLRIPGVTRKPAPPKTSLGLPGISPWQTSNEDFYRIDTSISVPAIEPDEWSIRIHGMVDRELTLTYSQLVARQLTESWITLNCVSNEVGGDLIGNARWSGVRLADLLEGLGVSDRADCVLQTSHDGWTCATPLAALTDDRDAMLAVAMNGRPLPIEHGFPVRTVVPGLYGYVSATKWVVDMEVSTFADSVGYWTTRGWSAQGPVKIASRIDVPSSGDEVAVGSVSVGGMAWHQHTGISKVEVQVDGGAWEPAELGRVPSDDTWVQWALTVDLDEGDHEVRVRATGKDGETQTSAVARPDPDGSTGWHTIQVSAR
ncbi:DMSO/TMAO reductase YedYZ, molybdopterin-dependent catalytic subunit [Nocardioides exalbidus]|uniref:DMSO/TMAO reductase YedYZ, molybdopterin-dependent catalytic subunit n=1 Tax=Nocardioides exalbidus TaxID=402596 RepID=A0A1H4SBK5_9ACTN|nr:molybdopterin-dependent oxidoreductase [Nocardioides exalbidus]SEC41374.1 DMSO/TMAO reductase YedYZ, molybdopterin-dependent catalytic subunit [Nocardioides exalbidus]